MEFSHEYWNSHQQGFEARAKILSFIQENPGITRAEISPLILMTPSQYKGTDKSEMLPVRIGMR